MGTIADKLNRVLETKNAIKQALINKGVEVSDTDSFESYAGKIDSIGGINLSGCCFWIDGQKNLRSGNDHTTTYMQDLMRANTYTTTTGYREYFAGSGSGNSWDGDFLTLGNYAYYPYAFNNSEMTVEAYVILTKTPSANIMVMTTGYTGGWYMAILTTNKARFGARLGDSYITANTTNTLELNTPYYIIGRYKSNGTVSVEVKELNEKVEKPFAGTMAYNLCNMGFGTQAYNSTSANGNNWDGLKVGMVRVWNRLLTDEEININHNDTVNRLKTEPVAPTTATITLNGLEYSSAFGGDGGQTFVYIDAGEAGSDGAHFDDLVTASVTVPIGTEVNLYCYSSFGFDIYKKTITANGDEVYEAKYDSLDSTWAVDG